VLTVLREEMQIPPTFTHAQAKGGGETICLSSGVETEKSAIRLTWKHSQLNSEELIGTPNQRTCDINLAVLDLPALNLSELRMKSGV
jgi:hypothetical protein